MNVFFPDYSEEDYGNIDDIGKIFHPYDELETHRSNGLFHDYSEEDFGNIDNIGQNFDNISQRFHPFDELATHRYSSHVPIIPVNMDKTEFIDPDLQPSTAGGEDCLSSSNYTIGDYSDEIPDVEISDVVVDDINKYCNGNELEDS